VTWDELGVIAPRTKALLEAAASGPPKPVLSEIPKVLGIPNVQPGSKEWADLLNHVTPEGITVRELLLRWLITRAIVDQGSDIVGVEMWHAGLLTDCYETGIRLLHDPINSLTRYGEIVKIGDSQRHRVTKARAQAWADDGKNRKTGQYTPFNVDNLRGGKQSHWFIAARMLPGLLTAFLTKGGLTDHVFGKANTETASEMSRRLRNDSVFGLGWSMGDKACDLFAKWAVGTFRLGTGLAIPWEPADCPLPMDQRIGRVLMRCGFMDEFFSVSRIMGVASNGFTSMSRPAQSRPKIGDPIPNGPWHLTVMNFRRNSKVREKSSIAWLKSVAHETSALMPAGWGPQDVLSMLCRSYNHAHKVHVTPVELDDFLMNVAGPCRDHDPDCLSCPLNRVCQANCDPSMVNLKLYFT
jgi:hypothetical protein